MNSLVTSITVTVVVILISVMCAYALSQIVFPGRRLLYGIILASFMVPSQGPGRFAIRAEYRFGLINSWGGIILPQLIVPVVVIVYKQFFDSVRKSCARRRSSTAAVISRSCSGFIFRSTGGSRLRWAIITYIMAWNAFLWRSS